MQFGDWVKQERTARGWSLKRLADAMIATGLTTASPQYVQQIERGEINAGRMGRDKLTALAAAFDMRVDEVPQASEVTDGHADAATLAALLDEGGVSDIERADYLALMEQLPAHKRAEVISHLRWLLSEHKAEQDRQAQARQRAARRREPARQPDLQEETQQRAGAGC